jgi:hypothetical protein
MKNVSQKFFLLIISFVLFSTNLFAQVPACPGGDPMEADSATYMVPLKAAKNKQLTPSGSSPSANGKDSNNKASEKLQLNKKEEEDTHIIF